MPTWRGYIAAGQATTGLQVLPVGGTPADGSVVSFCAVVVLLLFKCLGIFASEDRQVGASLHPAVHHPLFELKVAVLWLLM
jgi:hypothetical protein